VAASLDDIGVYTVSASNSTTISSLQLIDTTANASANRYDGRWVYSGSPQSQQLRVKPGGFAPSTGTLTLQTAMNAATVGSSIEITGMFPCFGQVPGEDASYQTLIARTLAKLLVPDRVSTPITADETIDLSAWPWLDRDERLLDVLAPAPLGTRPVSARWRGPRLIQDGGTPALELRVPFEAVPGVVDMGDLILEVMRPADTWISGAEIAPGTTGMTVDSHTTIAPLESIVLFAQMEACRIMMTRTIGRPDGGDWGRRFADLRDRSEQLYHFDGQFYKRKAPEPAAAGATAAGAAA
jgi:hypothetical protein